MFFPSSANNYNINPFSHLPSSSSSSSYHLPQHLLTHEANDNVVLNHHFHDLVSASSLLPAAANPQNETLLNMAFLNEDGNRGVLSFGGRPPPGHGFPVKKALKKDRHSKICTAQGVRERRVRLSIEIARDFFDLQDMLGFDKASKTVEWLLRKSRNAIKELAKMKQYGNVGGRAGGQKSLSLDSGDDDRYETVANNRVLELEGVVSKEKMSKKLQKSTAIPLKESRAKARARARERTREKMNSSRDLEWKTCPDLSPYGHSNMASSSFKLVAHQVEQVQPSETSIVIRRMLKPSAILGYQQSCNSSDSHGFPNLSQNWDINAAMAHSN